MRWNCPHCGTSLAVADDKIGNGWSFSRCYKCGGFGLVRRSDVNLIKVDRAPAGEHVLLPEAHENPTMMMSQAATQHLSRYTGANQAAAKSQQNPPIVQIAPAAAHVSAAAAAIVAARTTQAEAKPVIRPAIRRSLQNTPSASPQPGEAQVAAIPRINPPMPPTFTGAGDSIPSPSNGFGLPEPLPEVPVTGIRQRLLPIAIAGTGIFAIGSGIYLYIQGQALWEKARMQATESGNRAVSVGNTNAYSPSADNGSAPPSGPAASNAPAPGNEIVQAPTVASISGSANITSSPSIATGPAIAAAAPPARAEVVDEVHANAMAPTRGGSEPAAEAAAATSPQLRKMSIEVLVDNAHIHSGPGMKYPVIGAVSNQRTYEVEEWRDRWFKINLENPASKEPAPRNGAQKKTAWIRNDLVRPAP